MMRSSGAHSGRLCHTINTKSKNNYLRLDGSILHVAKVTCRGTASQPHGQVPELTKRAKHAPKFDHASNFASDLGEVADDGSQVVRRLCNLILLCSSQACESKLDDVAQRIDGFKEADASMLMIQAVLYLLKI